MNPMGTRKLSEKDFRRLSRYIEQEVGIKMPGKKRSMLESRLQRRLRELDMGSFSDYCRFVFDDPRGVSEIPRMINVVTTNKTEFVREPSHFAFMKDVALPELAERSRRVDLWSVAASTGQEAYNMAMYVEEFSPHFPYSVVATDINHDVLATARRGVYSSQDVSVMNPFMVRRYFLRSRNRNESMVRVKPHIRSRVEFTHMNLMKMPYPLSQSFDLVFCRNVLIYFSRENQEKIINEIFRHLNPGGFLFLGHSESLSGYSKELTLVSRCVYQRSLR